MGIASYFDSLTVVLASESHWVETSHQSHFHFATTEQDFIKTVGFVTESFSSDILISMLEQQFENDQFENNLLEDLAEIEVVNDLMVGDVFQQGFQNFLGQFDETDIIKEGKEVLEREDVESNSKWNDKEKDE